MVCASSVSCSAGQFRMFFFCCSLRSLTAAIPKCSTYILTSWLFLNLSSTSCVGEGLDTVQIIQASENKSLSLWGLRYSITLKHKGPQLVTSMWDCYFQKAFSQVSFFFSPSIGTHLFFLSQLISYYQNEVFTTRICDLLKSIRLKFILPERGEWLIDQRPSC